MSVKMDVESDKIKVDIHEKKTGESDVDRDERRLMERGRFRRLMGRDERRLTSWSIVVTYQIVVDADEASRTQSSIAELDIDDFNTDLKNNLRKMGLGNLANNLNIITINKPVHRVITEEGSSTRGRVP